MPIRCVVFDFGGVLYHTPDLGWIQRWESFLGIKDGAVTRLMTAPHDDPEMVDIMTGRVKEIELWQRVVGHLKISPRVVIALRKASLSKKRLNRPLVDFLAGLRPRYRTAILSNAGSDARATFIAAYTLEKAVDQVIISAEEGMMKPDERIYALTATRLDARPEEILFVDDLAVNVEAAQRFGMASVLHVDNAQTIAAVRDCLEAEG
jgi:putative hydrolase of the HAD superfamily